MHDSSSDTDTRMKPALRSVGPALARYKPSAVGRKRRIFVWLILALLVAGGAIVVGWLLRRPQEPPAAGKAAQAVTVGLAAVEKGSFEVTLDALGTVTPLATVSVKARISGHLVLLGFEEGQMVEKGDFLAEVDPRPYEHALAEANGRLAQDTALLDNARLDLDRYARLVSQNNASRKQLDTQRSLLRQYEGLVQIDQARVDQAKLDLDYCRVTAPVSGRIGLRLVDLGNYVQPGDATGIVVVTQLRPIAVVFPVAEDHLGKVMEPVLAGRKLEVEAYDRGYRKLLATGRLATIDNQVDPATGTVKFKAYFDNADMGLFPNQFVNIRLIIETLRDVILVPQAAVQYGPKGAFVFEVSDDDKAVVRPVDLGPADKTFATLRDGIEAGARVVVSGANRLRDGSKVKPAVDQAGADSPGLR
jgi:multidrug efflux system membrane fusion protein